MGEKPGEEDERKGQASQAGSLDPTPAERRIVGEAVESPGPADPGGHGPAEPGGGPATGGGP